MRADTVNDFYSSRAGGPNRNSRGREIVDAGFSCIHFTKAKCINDFLLATDLGSHLYRNKSNRTPS